MYKAVSKQVTTLRGEWFIKYRHVFYLYKNNKTFIFYFTRNIIMYFLKSVLFLLSVLRAARDRLESCMRFASLVVPTLIYTS